MRKPWVFVCSRYRAWTPEEMDENVARAEQLCRDVADAGGVPMAPHLYFPWFFRDDVPEEREAGIALGLEWLRRCDMMLVDLRLGVSDGMQREIDEWGGLPFFLTYGNLAEEFHRFCEAVKAFHVKHEKEAK